MSPNKWTGYRGRRAAKHADAGKGPTQDIHVRNVESSLWELFKLNCADRGIPIAHGLKEAIKTWLNRRPARG